MRTSLFDGEQVSTRLRNALWGNSIESFEDAATYTESELNNRIPHFGPKTINELRLILQKRNLHFGMQKIVAVGLG